MSTLTNALWVSLPIPALILDAEDRIRDLNPVAETFLNASQKSLDGAVMWDRIHMSTPLKDSVARVRNSASSLHVNAVDVGSGTRKPVSCDVQISALADRPDHVLVLMENRELVGRMDRAMSSKTAAKSAIGMAEMLAHEIKNPLAGITGAAQLISMNANAEDRELTDLIVAETRRVLKLLEQVEDFGNVRPPERRAVNIHDVLDHARRSASVGFAAHMNIIEDYDPSLPHTWADPDQLQQVIMNLLKNAAEAGQSGGTICLRTFYEMSLKVRRPDGSAAAVPLQIEVSDDGSGIAPELVKDVFEPFVSGRENGTGLGLALISKIVADHDGWVAVDSVPGRTTFRISLPIAPKEAS
ncbi:two-component system sensor histidine kinase NtrB [Jannaschia sp. CCS1]|uniref:two-component system sensor histidine kinase NtrB n=1 Tax=Jannaschia sp. (strain CCS1) TaxID=290400 RepID=UPI000053A987|nr:ATP-binding protein [Jannaschia sp. CCS1]ABD55154.1 signal transduction histidine kinase, nitrogen specific, NtrB [Jannaschia sp. CCS1]